MASNRRLLLHTELEKMCMEAAVAGFDIPPRLLHERTGIQTLVRIADLLVEI